MPRPLRTTVQGVAYRLLNRRVMRLAIFQKPADYEAFERILALGVQRPHDQEKSLTKKRV